jgi:hypothetical protein
MRRFLRKSALFLAPVAAYMLAIMWVDPFDLFPVFAPLGPPQGIKDTVASGNEDALYKFIRYRNRPAPNIILGDSRMYSLDSGAIRAASGEDYFNFAIQGASFGEIADAFWFAAGRSELKHVVIGLNFLLFNESNRKDRTTGAKCIVRNPLLYFCNYPVLKASLDVVESLGSGAIPLGRPKMSKERFWRYVLYEETVPGYLNRYRYPHSFVAELERMTAYAKAHAIDLRFVIPPTHQDLQKRVEEMGFSAQVERFKAQLRELAPTYDFEYANALTADSANFKDPMHYNAQVGRGLVEEIWGQKPVYARFSRPSPTALP